ncbi:hypothetical protein [Paenibacillus pinihumi]|uniref:hypothetical protein n=1 Tax=Paenibacillus pinihumi TaxID=669462 RepID=UPI00048FDF5A|nr:hypothetical protein [Paenibacillus pinihumi]
MFNLIFGFVIVWLILSSAILIHLKIKERRDIQQQIRQVAQTFNTTPELVLFLDYTSPDFKEIDELLLSETPVSFVVVFRAPIWLIEVKKKKWVTHHVLSNTNIISLLDSGGTGTKALRIQKEKFQVFHEIPALIRLTALQK